MSRSHKPAAGATRSRWLRRAEFADFVPFGQQVAEQQAAPLARLLIVVVGLLFGAVLTWASLSQVDQVATAPGVVRPVGKVKVINHPDGGRVASLQVTEGERVRAGQVMFALDSDSLTQEIAKLESEWLTHAARVIRLQAETEGVDPDFRPEIESARPDLVAMQKQLFDARQQSLKARRDAADQVIEQRVRNAGASAQREKHFRRSLDILQQQETAISDLANKGYFPRLRYLSIQRQVSDLEGQVAEAGELEKGARAALAEAHDRRISLDQEWRSKTLEALAAARRDRDRMDSLLSQKKIQLRNLSVHAPVDGIVQDITVTAPGQSIRANEPLLSIVPTDAQLIVEARVSNDDIGHVSVGQRATVKFEAYDHVRYGALDGIVERITADAERDRHTGEMTFGVTIKTRRLHLGPRPADRPMNPGMQAMVDLHIGKRSILSYLTDRLERTAKSAFRER